MNVPAMSDIPKISSVKTLSVQDIENASLARLRFLFEAVFQRPPPAKISPWVLRGNLAWAIQARAQGENDRRLRTRILKHASKGSSSTRIQFKIGTRLIRSWEGETHEVTVLEKGYWYRAAHFSSLSEIARVITGTRWSGPRFFGLDMKQAKQS